jgi:glutamate synthase (ferredoxin)
MVNPSMNSGLHLFDSSADSLDPGYGGQPWLVEERDACGVGFIADQQGRSSHDLVAKTLAALGCMEHRGGCSADRDSGDGAGILTAIPWGLFQAEGRSLVKGRTGLGMVFLPQNETAAKVAKDLVNAKVAAIGLTLIGWRSVPVNPKTLGVQASSNLPASAAMIWSGFYINCANRLSRLFRWLSEQQAWRIWPMMSTSVPCRVGPWSTRGWSDRMSSVPSTAI